jgi:outer membrane protein assembly factor BamB
MARGVAAAILFGLLLPFAARAADLGEDLWTAARRGDAEAVRALLDRGADANAKTAYGTTALFLAADRGHLEVVRVLLQHKADVNAKDTFYQSTALDWAARKEHAEVVKALLEAGAKGGDDVLVSAAASGSTDMVRAVLAKGKPKPDALTRALKATPTTKTEIAELLKKAGAKPAPATPATAVVEVPADTLKAYAGVYRNDKGQEYEVMLISGKLAILADGSGFMLNARDKTTFQSAQDSTLTVTFKRDGGKVTGLVTKRNKAETPFTRREPRRGPAATPAGDDGPVTVASPQNWPSFRGPQAAGVADGQKPPTTWDVPKEVNVRWKTPIPGLGHSCPVVWGDRVFLTTAISSDPKAELRTGLYGDVEPSKDTSEHVWKVYCLDKQSGRVVWERTAHRGVPKVKRHPKGSQANCTPAADAGHLVVCFGSEGLYCYDHGGALLWKRDLGDLDAGWFFDRDYQWGFGSSPIVYRDLAIVQCDVGKGSFIAAYRLSDGGEAWRTPRDEVASWGTPTVYEGPGRAELITNGTRHARGYDPLTGKELWRLGKQSEITVPTPFVGQGLIFIASGYRPIQPIYAVRPGANGDIAPAKGKTTSDAVAWSTQKGGPYMTTPIVYGEHLYVCSNNGMLVCYEAKTGKQVYRERLGGSGGYTASPVAADGRLYFTSEEDGVRVVRAGPRFELLSENPLGEACLATPAIADGMLFFRTQHHVVAVGRSGTSKVNPSR